MSRELERKGSRVGSPSNPWDGPIEKAGSGRIWVMGGAGDRRWKLHKRYGAYKAQGEGNWKCFGCVFDYLFFLMRNLSKLP